MSKVKFNLQIPVRFVALREDFLAITGKQMEAILLNVLFSRLEFEGQNDFDELNKLKERKAKGKDYKPKLANGKIKRSRRQLCRDMFLSESKASSVDRWLTNLSEKKGFVNIEKNKNRKADEADQLSLNVEKIDKELKKKGFPPLPLRKITNLDQLNTEAELSTEDEGTRSKMEQGCSKMEQGCSKMEQILNTSKSSSRSSLTKAKSVDKKLEEGLTKLFIEDKIKQKDLVKTHVEGLDYINNRPSYLTETHALNAVLKLIREGKWGESRKYATKAAIEREEAWEKEKAAESREAKESPLAQDLGALMRGHKKPAYNATD